MKYRLPFIILLLALLLAACQADTSTPALTNEPVSEESQFAAATASETPPEAEPKAPATDAPPTPTLEQAPAEVSAPPGCTVQSPRPTPGPTQQSIFPPVSEEDWSFGPEDAFITIVEYGDFQ